MKEAWQELWSGWTTTAFILGFLAILVFAVLISHPAKQVADQVTDVFRSVDGVQCLPNWTETKGTDPDSRLSFKTCTDGRYIITIRENRAPVGFDQSTGKFLTPEETATFLR